MKHFAHYNARSVEEALNLLRKGKGKARINAGGTDLLGALKDRITRDYPECVVNIKSIRGLDYIREESDGLKIGALTKLAGIVDSPLIKEKYGILAEAAKSVATPQIRNMCTIGGNIAQDVRCWYYRYPDELGGTVTCLRKGGPICNALVGDNRYHSIFGSAPLRSYPCASACPAKTAIPSCLAKIKDGELGEAARIFVDANPMPAITGRVCPAFCESECNRGALDGSVSVRSVERSLGDYLLDHGGSIYGPPENESGKKIAIIGSGPSGLAAAFYLRRAGHGVTVYERMAEPGGMLLYSIPGYRLPKEVVRKQTKALEWMGVVFKCGVEIGKDPGIDELQRQFDAVLVATGAWKEKVRDRITSDASISGLEFLKGVSEGHVSVPGRKIAVIGGGNVAVDVARTLVRLGAKPVVLYRRTPKEMPAFRDEVEKAREEGVAFKFLTLPTRVTRGDGMVSLTCVKMRLGATDQSGRRRPVPREGSQFTLVFDASISAVGEEPDRSLLPPSMKKRMVKSHRLGRGVYGAGDFVGGSSTVIEAVASGREAAGVIDEDLGGRDMPSENGASHGSSWAHAAYEPSARVASTEASVTDRLKGLSIEDRQSITADEARRQAGRCLNCGCAAVAPSDIGVALVAMGGKIVTTKRRIEASAFFAPDATASTVLDADEMITEILVPKIADGARQRYLKFTLRKPLDFAVISVGTIVAIENGLCSDARIALGAVAPAPFRASRAEQRLVGNPVNDEAASIAAEAAVEGAMPLNKNGYKVQLTKALVKRAILGET